MAVSELYSIHTVPSKRATDMVKLHTIDAYHSANQRAAKTLIEAGHSEAVYLTQWSSGTSLWQLPNDSTLTVTIYGKIEG